MYKILLVLTILFLIGTVAAQKIDSSQAEYQKPSAYTYSESMCIEYRTKALYQVTNIDLDSETQQRYLNAAEAYRILGDELGQMC